MIETNVFNRLNGKKKRLQRVQYDSKVVKEKNVYMCLKIN